MPRGWPLLRRAPARLVHSGSLAVMVLVSVALLSGLVAAGPLFGSATAAGGLTRRLAAIPSSAPVSQQPAIRMTVGYGPTAESEPRLRALVDAIPYVGGGRTTVMGDALELDSRRPLPYVRSGSVQRVAMLYFRTGVVPALQVVSGTPGAPGIWLNEAVAGDLKAGPGSVVQVGLAYGATSDRHTDVKVAGVYRSTGSGRVPAGSFPLDAIRELPKDPDPKAFPLTVNLLIGDRVTIDTAIAAVHEESLWRYDAGLTAPGRTPQNLGRAAAGADSLRLRAAQPGSPVASLVSGLTTLRIDSGLGPIHTQAVADARVARQQGRGIAYAGAVLGLAAVLMAMRALAQRRRRETELMLGLGSPTWVVVAAGIVELLLPVVLGAAVGCAAAVAAFRLAGPSRQLDLADVRSAAAAAGLVALAALACNALVTLGQARQVARSLAGQPVSRLGAQWLPLLTGATVLAVVATLTRERDQSYRDPMAALLPILVLACGCSLVARGASLAAAAVQRRQAQRQAAVADAPGRRSHQAQPQPRPGRLVLRGLRRTGVAVADLVIVLGIGIGVLAYGLTSATLVHQSVTDKAAVLAGAPTTAHINHSWLLGGGYGPSPQVGDHSAVVWRAQGVMTPDDLVYDILAVDPTRLAAAATWGAGRELRSARAALSRFPAPPADVATAPSSGPGATSPVPALLVGPTDRKAGTTAKLQVGVVTFPVVGLARLSAFPGTASDHPTIVLDARILFPRLSADQNPSEFIQRSIDLEGDFVAWLWTHSSLPEVQQRLAQDRIPLQETFTLAQARATPALTSSRWAATYQVVLGLAAAGLAGLAVVVAVDRRVARAAAVDLVLQRFGFRPRRLLALRTGELVATALGALAVLVGPLAVMVVLLPRLVEPDTAVPPVLPAQVTPVPLLLSAAAVIVVVATAALVAARRSATLQPGEVLRDDT